MKDIVGIILNKVLIKLYKIKKDDYLENKSYKIYHIINKYLW